MYVQAMAPVKPKKFTVALNTTFFDCARYGASCLHGMCMVTRAHIFVYVHEYCVYRCCGAHIIGCYAPTGEHCERPLEVS